MENVELVGVDEIPEFFENLKWMTIRDAALYLRRSTGAVKNLIYRGKVRARKWAGRVYLSRKEIDEAIENGLL